MKSIRLILIAILPFLLLGSSVLAATQVYTTGRAFTASGGSIRMSEDYRTRDIIGQTGAGPSISADYMLYSGFHSPSQPLPATEPEKPQDYREYMVVGGDIYTTNKLAVLAPWIALGVIILAGGVYLMRRRVYS